MATLKDLNIESLPEKVASRDGWYASKHTLDYPPNELDDHLRPIEYLLVSKDDEEGVPRLHYLSASGGSQRTNTKLQDDFVISTIKSDWLTPLLIVLAKSEPMDTASVYDQFTKSAARTLLTGHYLATKHKKLFDLWSKAGKSEGAIEDATQTYWNPLIANAGGVTKLTVQIYQELAEWGEASSPSLISILMNTGPRTVHTRLQEARKLGLLGKPGIGSRKVSRYETTLEKNIN